MREEAMKSLVGRKIHTESAGTWTFETLGEFQKFDLTHGTNYGDVVDLEVAAHVKGFFSGAEHDFQLLLTYQKSKDAVTLMCVKPL
jgi:hypothetical protein